MKRLGGLLGVVILLGQCSVAQADKLEAGRVNFLIALAARESSGDKSIVNPYGYLGLFQMGGRAMVDAGFYILGASRKENSWDGTFTPRAAFVEVSSKATYLNNAGAQELAVRAYHDVQWDRIVQLGLAGKVGQAIGNITLTKSGMVAGAHLVGVGSLARWIRSNGADDVPDGNHVPVSDYVSQFGGYF